MLKPILTTIAAVAAVEMRHDIAVVVRYVAKETRRTVMDRINATRSD